MRKTELDSNIEAGVADNTTGLDQATIADIVNICLDVDPSKSRYAALAQQIAQQLTKERQESLDIIDQLTSLINIKDQETSTRSPYTLQVIKLINK